jgi:hypothetical protein
MSKVLEDIDSSKNANGMGRGKAAGDGNIEGITADGDARHGTEAGLLKDFAEKGYDALKVNHTLDTTTDTHVRSDGSNKDNGDWFFDEVGKALGAIFQPITSVLSVASFGLIPSIPSTFSSPLGDPGDPVRPNMGNQFVQDTVGKWRNDYDSQTRI